MKRGKRMGRRRRDGNKDRLVGCPSLLKGKACCRMGDTKGKRRRGNRKRKGRRDGNKDRLAGCPRLLKGQACCLMGDTKGKQERVPAVFAVERGRGNMSRPTLGSAGQ